MKRLTLCMMVVAAMLTVDTSMAGLDKQESQLRLELDLDDGSHIIGIPSIESIPVQTSYAKMDIALKQILIIKIADHETTSINLLNGDKLNGTIKTEPIRLETVFGKVSVAFEHIRELRVVPSGWGGFMTNAARDAKVEVNRSSPGNGLPEKVNDGVTNDVAQPYTSYWFAGEGPPKPDWIRLRFDKPALIRSIRILAPLGTTSRINQRSHAVTISDEGGNISAMCLVCPEVTKTYGYPWPSNAVPSVRDMDKVTDYIYVNISGLSRSNSLAVSGIGLL